MSTFGWSNISGIDDDSGATPGGINGSVQFNDNGINFAGVSDFTYNDATKTLNVTKILATNITGTYIKPITLVDAGGSYGANGQVLKSNGLTTIWSNDAAGSDRYVQYNRTGMLAGDVGFQYDEGLQRLEVSNIGTNNIRPGVIEDNAFSTGNSTQILSSNGSTSNNLVWIDNPNAVGGPTDSIQFNNSGVFGGSADFVRNPSTGDVNINANLGVGSLVAPTDRLVVRGANATIRVKSTGTNSGFLVIEDSSSGVKQLTMQVNTDTADFTSIQQGVAFRNFRFNPTQNTSCISVGTTGAQAIGGFMCSTALSNRKVILFSVANDEHQNHSLGVNTDTFRFQIPTTTNRYGWFAATSSSTSNELMRLTGTGLLQVGGIVAAPVARLFSLSGSAVIGSWNNQWLIIGTSSDAAAPAVGLGYNTAGNYGMLACVAPGIEYKTMRHYALAHTFYNNNVINMDLTSTGNLVVGRTASSLITISKGTGTTASSSYQGYLKVGGAEYGTTAGTRRMIGFGYNTGTNNQPAYIGYEERVTTGDSQGDLIFGTRNTTTGDVIPTERMRILANGCVGIGTSTPSTTLQVVGTATISDIYTISIKPDVIYDSVSSGGTAGQLLSSTGTTLQWKNPPAAGSNFQVQFNSSGSLAADSVFTYNNGTQYLLVPNVQCSGRITPTLIQDTNPILPSTGTIGQYLSSSLSGILWTDRPLPYSNSLSAVGAFITTAPISTTPATVTFGGIPRLGKYRMTTNVVAYPTAANVTVTVEIWTRQSGATNYSLLYSTQTFMNSTNIHLAFPAKSFYITLTAGSFIEVVIRTGANTGSGSVDPVNIDILECIN